MPIFITSPPANLLPLSAYYAVTRKPHATLLQQTKLMPEIQKGLQFSRNTSVVF